MDPENETILGEFDGFIETDTFAPEFDGARLYTVRYGMLQAWECANYAAGAAARIASTNAVTSDLLRWGADGLALLEHDRPVWLRSSVVRTSLGNDADFDGMPDEWELRFGLNPNLADTDNDSDWDGVNDLEEFSRGSNPMFAEGPLRLLARAVSTTELVVRFAGQNGKFYRVEHTAMIASPDWQPLKTGVPGEGTMISFSLPLSSAPEGFLRVVEQASP